MKALPFGSELPICRCLQDPAARELRCALLHPDFLMTRRVPLPVVAGREFTEQWEFLALTRLDGPVTMSVSGAGIKQPLRHSFGAANQLQPGTVERFVVKAVGPAVAKDARGLATIEYRIQGSSGTVPRVLMVRTLDETAVPKSRDAGQR
jgi:hypothetical protein